MQTDAKDIYSKFSKELCEWSESGKTPDTVDQELRYSLNLQRQRMDEYGIKMKCSLDLRGEWLDNIFSHRYEGKKYSNYLVSRSYDKTITYFMGERKKLCLQDKEELCSMVTYLNDETSYPEEIYCCPSCGAVNKLESLTDQGCSYCNTRFLISELFPKVTNFYFLKAVSMSTTESKKENFKYILAGIIVGLLCISPMALTDLFAVGQEEVSFAARILLFIWRYVVCGVLGAAAGYGIGALKLIVKTFSQAAQAIPKVTDQLNAKRRVTDFVTKMDPDFSYEHFFGKVQSLVKLLIFSKNRNNLVTYEGPLPLDQFDSIIESQFDGVLGFHRAWVQGDYCFLDLKVYMTNIFAKPNGLKKKSKVYTVVLCRKTGCKTDYGFSITKVSCPDCGGSFDASMMRRCPYCQSPYDLKENDWTITYIR